LCGKRKSLIDVYDGTRTRSWGVLHKLSDAQFVKNMALFVKYQGKEIR